MAIISSAASTLTLSLTPNTASTSSSLSVSTTKIPSLSSCSSLFFSRNRALVPSRARRTSKLVSNDKKGLSCNCLFGLGVPELVVVAGVAALVFGPKKLPDVGRSIGKTVKSFQQAAKEFETELKKEPDASIDPPVEKAREIGQEEKQDASVSSTKES